MAYEPGRDWRILLLDALGAPSTPVNLDALALWAQSEGTPAGWYNWLATTEPGYGGRDVNTAGVKAYPSRSEGVAATAATLHLGYYVQVVAALRAGNSLQRIWQAVNSSPWCAHCQGGRYPVALYDHLGTPPPGTGVPPPAPPPAAGGSTAGARAVSAFDQVRTALGRTAGQQLARMTTATQQLKRSIR